MCLKCVWIWNRWNHLNCNYIYIELYRHINHIMYIYKCNHQHPGKGANWSWMEYEYNIIIYMISYIIYNLGISTFFLNSILRSPCWSLSSHEEWGGDKADSDDEKNADEHAKLGWIWYFCLGKKVSLAQPKREWFCFICLIVLVW